MDKESQFLKPIYLDYNATTPPFLTSGLIKSWMNTWGNPSSIHWAGRDSKELIRQSRERLARWIGAHPNEIIFTSGASESNNLAIRGFFSNLFHSSFLSPLSSFRLKDKEKAFLPSKVDRFRKEDKKNNRNEGAHQNQENKDKKINKDGKVSEGGRVSEDREIDLLISAVEHPSVFEVAQALQLEGLKYDIIPVDRNGNIDLKVYEEKLEKKPKLVSIMFANNETGNIFPIKKLVNLAHKSGALFHCDAVQALGKVFFNVKHLDLDLASFSGHKFYALKGSGFLYKKSGVSIKRLISGGGQERGFRAGTENVLSIASMGSMAEYFHSQKEKVNSLFESVRKKRDEMEKKILSSIQDVFIVGRESKRLPNTSNLIFRGLSGESLLMSLDLKGFALSSGAACSSGTSRPSSVLMAMGYSPSESKSSLRVSLGLKTKRKEINFFLKNLIQSVKLLRETSKQRFLN